MKKIIGPNGEVWGALDEVWEAPPEQAAEVPVKQQQDVVPVQQDVDVNEFRRRRNMLFLLVLLYGFVVWLGWMA